MPKFTRGVEPVAFFVGTEPVLRKYLGSVLIWDGTRSAVAQAIRAQATASARPAVGVVSIGATAIAATASAGAHLAVATASAGGLVMPATASAAVRDHEPHADAAAITATATATATVHTAVADENFDAVANAVAAVATAQVSGTATASAAALAPATPATATTLVLDAHGQGSNAALATPATATGVVVSPQVSASASATTLAATASASVPTAVPSTGSTVPSTPATATASVSSAGGSTGKHYADDFNRSNSTSLGADWRVDRNASPKIDTNRAQMKTMANGDGRAGCWASYQGGADSGRLASDNYGVKLQFIAPVGNVATNNMTGGVLAVSDTFGAGVMCYFVATTTNGVAIYTQSGLPPASGVSTGQTGQTQRAVTATNAALTDLFEFVRVGNVFTLYRNGSSFLTWTDTGNLVSTGASFRRFGFFCEGNYPIFNAEFRSSAVDSIEGYDL